MTKYFIQSLLLFSLLAGAAMAEDRHEVGGDTSTRLSLYKSGSSESTFFLIDLNYAYRLTDIIQIGGEFAYDVSKSPNVSPQHYTAVFVGPTFNFNKELEQAIYAQIAVGIYYQKYRSYSDTDLAVKFAVGKRFRIAENVAFKPYISYVYVDEDNSTRHAMNFVPLSLSVLFD